MSLKLTAPNENNTSKMFKFMQNMNKILENYKSNNIYIINSKLPIPYQWFFIWIMYKKDILVLFPSVDLTLNIKNNIIQFNYNEKNQQIKHNIKNGESKILYLFKDIISYIPNKIFTEFINLLPDLSNIIKKTKFTSIKDYQFNKLSQYNIYNNEYDKTVIITYNTYNEIVNEKSIFLNELLEYGIDSILLEFRNIFPEKKILNNYITVNYLVKTSNIELLKNPNNLKEYSFKINIPIIINCVKI